MPCTNCSRVSDLLLGAVPPADHAARRERLRRRVGELGLDAMLVTDPLNVRWLSGFTGSNGQLLLAASGADDDRLITDGRYDERAAHEAPDLERILERDPSAVVRRRYPGAYVGFEAEHLTWAQGQRFVEIVTEEDGAVAATSGEVETLRQVKDDHELALLRRACEVTTVALGWLFDEHVAPGRTEAELGRLLEQRFVDLGADGAAFDTIVASGPNASVPHHSPGDRPLEVGDVLTVDCGARVGGYHADCTRTVAIGRIDPPMDAVYDLVRRAQALGREAAVAGASAADVDAATRAPISAAGYGDRFVHGTGHGVGLEIHEAPAVSQTSRATLCAGMTLTVEPGVYLPGIGGVRIEDTVVVTPDGPPGPLTEMTRELRIL
jgi:Xaa-Pro aminopeptidase